MAGILEPHPKIVTLLQAQELIRRAKSLGQEVILATGAFDVIHTGHVRFLKNAKEHGDVLFVGLDSDENVRRNKGANRPLNGINDRLHVIAALDSVDFVFDLDDILNYEAHDASADRLRFLKPTKLALAFGDPFTEIRKKVAEANGVEGCLVGAIWKEHSSTKLLKAMHR